MRFDRAFDWGILLLYVALVFVLVRPGSKGVALFDSVGNTLVRLVNASTGGGGWSGTGK